MESAVAVKSLVKRFGAEVALKGVTFEVEKNRLFGLVGADGAGKSTLMRILATLVPADGGEAWVAGFSIQTGRQRIRSEIGFMPQHFSLYADLSVWENLNFFSDIFGVTGTERKRRIDRLLDFSRLGPFKGRPAGKLSGGMKQKLALCCALVHSPKLLILDEPTTGVDPVSRKEFWKIISDIREEGVTILLATPYMDEASRCDEVVFMHRGELLCSGTPRMLIENFKEALFSVRGMGESTMLHCPSAASLPDEIESIYPSGGELRLLVSQEKKKDAASILRLVQTLNPQAAHIEPCRPQMEDLFFHLVTKAERRRTC